MWKLSGVALALVLAAPLAGCSASGGSSGLQVVAGFYPLQYVAQRVAGENAEVSNLTRPGVEPHDTELSPSQVAGVAEADVIVSMRGFQPALDEAIANVAGDAVVVDPAAADFKTQNGPEVRAERPALLAGPLPDGRPRRRRCGRPGEGSTRRTATPTSATPWTCAATCSRLDREYAEKLADCAENDGRGQP